MTLPFGSTRNFNFTPANYTRGHVTKCIMCRMRSVNPEATADVASAIWNELRARVVLPTPAARRRIRREANLTQAKVAKIVGVDRTQIVRWEQGQTKPRGANARRYAEALRAMQGVQ
jgi:DNA-binding XRE family transcriptional regulator